MIEGRDEAINNKAFQVLVLIGPFQAAYAFPQCFGEIEGFHRSSLGHLRDLYLFVGYILVSIVAVLQKIHLRTA